MKLEIANIYFTNGKGIKHTIKDFDEYYVLIEGSRHNIKFLFN